MTISWELLGKNHPSEMVEEMRRRIDSGEAFTTSAEQWALDTDASLAEATALLETLAADGLLKRTSEFRCQCGEELTEVEASGTRCPHCGGDFSDVGSPKKSTVYVREGKRRRDVRWVLVLHGMNTRGVWQEELNWRVGGAYLWSICPGRDL